MAMAGCFACPMFNMLFGLGTALMLQTANVYPEAYELRFHLSIVVAFVFLLLSLMGSLLIVTWNRFRVPKFWGFCLVGLYVVFMVISLIIAKFSVWFWRRKWQLSEAPYLNLHLHICTGLRFSCDYFYCSSLLAEICQENRSWNQQLNLVLKLLLQDVVGQTLFILGKDQKALHVSLSVENR